MLQSRGELIARGLSLTGPVIGMVLILVTLRWTRVRESVAVCADFLLSHLSLLFVPVGIGVMMHLSLVSRYGLRMLVVVIMSTLPDLGMTILSLYLLRDRTVSQSKEGPLA